MRFDGRGDAAAESITRPVEFAGHDLGIVTATDNLQDAPAGPAEFALPQVYLVDGKLVADLRSVQVLYNGPDSASCVEAAGQGCWLIGAERATGTYDPDTHAFTLQWFSGQSFTSSSAGTVVHLAGRFVGAKTSLPAGHTVELGTQSFAAGAPGQVQSVADDSRTYEQSTGSQAPAGSTTAGIRTSMRATSVSEAARVAEPFAITGAATAIVLQLMVFLEFGRKRRTT